MPDDSRGGEEALDRARTETEELRLQVIRDSQQRDELLSTISHELRTPITVIDGFNKLLLSEDLGPLNDRQRHCLDESRRSCQRLHLFVANLLEKDRLSAGRNPVSMKSHPVADLFAGVSAFLDPLIREKGQELEVTIGPDAERACFDPASIEQVLVNLIGNALKYGPQGGTIRLEAQALGGTPERVEIAVLDEGPGIPHDDRERIFEPYVRRAEHAGSGGLGLGLAISRRIVMAHGGSIGVGEAPGGGSRFALTVPRHEAAQVSS